jgi:hypothetical protein
VSLSTCLRRLREQLHPTVLRKPNKKQHDSSFFPTAIRFLKYSDGLIVSTMPIGYAFLKLVQ